MSKPKGIQRISTTLRLTREEKQLLKIAAALFDSTMGPYIRRVALEHASIAVQGSGVVRVRLNRDERIIDDSGKQDEIVKNN